MFLGSGATSALHSFPTRRSSDLELVVSGGEIPDDIPVHLKLDTGMGRWGLAELPAHAGVELQMDRDVVRSEEHTSELQSLRHLVCRLLLEKKKNNIEIPFYY